MIGLFRIERKIAQQPQRLEDQRARCYHLSRHNLWELMLFLLVSICAFNVRDCNLFFSASEPLRQLLGYPPPAYLVSIALVAYFSSAVVLNLSALLQRSRPEQTWNHLGYRSAFYFFYSFTGTVAEHFLPVFLIGLTLYALDQCHLRLYTTMLLKECGAAFERS
jgi:hypothetical protein